MGTTPSKELFSAARRGNVDAMVQARAAGGDLNMRDEEKGETPVRLGGGAAGARGCAGARAARPARTLAPRGGGDARAAL